jgi:ATP-dependent Clp protease ATP-binding subunit ClpC
VLGAEFGHNDLMFERYTERARRVLFFARYESSQLASMTIEPEHVLLGILREKSHVGSQILNEAGVTLEGVTDELQRTAASREKISTSMEIPFSPSCQHVLEYAAEEADALQHAHIGTEHLLLGLLREGASPAAQLLARHGIRLEKVRDKVAAAPSQTTLTRSVTAEGARRAGDDEEIARRIKGIRDAVQMLELEALDDDVRQRAASIRRGLDDLGSFLLS